MAQEQSSEVMHPAHVEHLPFPLTLGDHPRMKKRAAVWAARIECSCPKLSAYLGDALLGICFGRGLGLRWQLKHRCFLTLT